MVASHEDGTTAPQEWEYTKYRLRSNAIFTDDLGNKIDRLQWTEKLLKPEYYSYIYYTTEDNIYIA
ncbi:MAG: hypothetical protein E7270_00910 [Lachnospiraceae bacterium]|nr:hypothetical protein [Lachnospiraceae bacterium]